MSDGVKTTKKYSFEVPKEKEEPVIEKKIEKTEQVPESESESETTQTESKPVSTPVAETKEKIIAQPLKTVGDIKTEYAKMSAKQYEGTFVQPEGSVIPSKFDLDEELRKLLVPNTDYDMVRTLVRFDGADTNYYMLEVHPERVYKAWKLFAEHDGVVPGKFMEKVFAILSTNNQRYFHKISTIELR